MRKLDKILFVASMICVFNPMVEAASGSVNREAKRSLSVRAKVADEFEKKRGGGSRSARKKRRPARRRARSAGEQRQNEQAPVGGTIFTPNPKEDVIPTRPTPQPTPGATPNRQP
jgi:hypothetical protein